MRRSFILLCCLFAIRLSILAQPCPAGERGDPYPGQCGAYQDADRDSLCDLSKSTIGDSVGEGDTLFINSINNLPLRGLNYHLLELALAVAMLAVATEVAQARCRTLTLRLQSLWNWLLLLSFLGSALTGLYFIIPIADRPRTSLNLSFWHAEASLLFIAVGLYHTVRRFATMLRGLGVLRSKP